MAVRSTMSDLISKVRLLIGDPAGSSQQFDDQAVQDALDAYRCDLQYEPLSPVLTLAPAGVQWLDYYSAWGYWEADAVVIDGHYAPLTPLSRELLLDRAHWIFQASGSGQPPPVFARGKSYDIYAAAADLLESWAASAARLYAFSADGASFQRQQIAPGLRAQADYYRMKARPKVVRLLRDDVNANRTADDDPRRAALGPVSAGVPFITGD